MGIIRRPALPTRNMKSSIIFAALLAVATCRPQDEFEVEWVREEAEPIDGYKFKHEFELNNGIAQSVVGHAEETGAYYMTGSYVLPLGDGTFGPVSFVADANGFRPESPLLPVNPANPHPVPAHVQEQLAFIDAQHAAGLVYDQAAQAWV